MTEEEVVKILKERLRIKVKSDVSWNSDEPTSYTIQLVLVDPKHPYDEKPPVISEDWFIA